MKLTHFSKGFFAFFLAAALFSSCKKDESFTDCLLGTWNITSAVVDGDEVIVDGTTLTLEFVKSASNSGIANFTFDAGTPDEEKMAGTFTSDDNNKTINLSIDGDVGVFTTSCKNDKIQMVGALDGDPFSFTGTRK